jgi:streptomycin 6-kinase
VLKIGFPHYEARDEAAGLRFWDGDPTVRLLAADEETHALVIDPKPFVGDPAYDVTQHVINCKRPRDEVVVRMSALLDLDPDRVRQWLRARELAEFF